MMFFFFGPPADKHLRKSREYLEDAKLKRVEHQAAAEHHQALTALYARRIGRIESEISQALQAASSAPAPVLPADGRQRACRIRFGAGVSEPRFARLSAAPSHAGAGKGKGKRTRNARSFRLAIARLLPHDSGQFPGASQFIQPNDVEPVDRLDLPPALGTPMPAIRHGANFHAPRAKPDGRRIGSIAHAGRGAFHLDHACTLPKGCFCS
jgi:hypothetical protein